MATTSAAVYGEGRAGRPPAIGAARRRGARAAGRNGDERLARALGWFSIGLGVAELAAPRTVARAIGLSDRTNRRLLLRAFGLREIASGLGILARPSAGAVWTRVGGDAIDLAALGRAFRARDADASRLGTATAAVAGVTALDVLCGQRLRRAEHASIETRKAVTVNKPRAEVYRAWRDFESFPRFMRHLESVRTTGDRRSHWVATGPMGVRVEWDAELTEDQPDARVAWRSLAGAEVDNAGVVDFADAPGGRGTVVHVVLRYGPPGGVLGAKIAKLFGKEPSQEVGEDLRRFKQWIEAGEVATGEGPSARRRPSLYRR